MEIISKVSKGSKMDQIYIPKNRPGFTAGNFVVIKPLEAEREKPAGKLYFYGVKELEPIKLEIIHEVLRIVDKLLSDYENIIVTGSFLEEGFNFNDIDILIVTKYKINQKAITEDIKKKTGVRGHILSLSNKELSNGLETDPLYQMMLSRCAAKKRFLYKTKRRINYKLLDLHLIKSKALPDNFDILSGKEKYDLIRNAVAICLYLDKKKVSVDSVDREIKKVLGVGIQEIKNNVLDKKAFLKRYKLIYEKASSRILRGIAQGSE